MQETPEDDYSGLDELLSRNAPSLRPIIRWLAVGPLVSRSLFAEQTREPTFGELGQLVRLARRLAPELLATVQNLVLRSDHAEVLHAELQLEVLVAQEPGSWTHPVQVLERPRADYAVLLEACEQRITELRESGASDRGGRLESVREKLARAARIAATAERRRKQKKLQEQREERRRQRQAARRREDGEED